jgi:hypothetical protein
VETPSAPRRAYSQQHSEVSGCDSEHAFSDDGVDLTLIRWMLSLTPMERLRVLESTVASILSLRRARGADGLS